MTEVLAAIERNRRRLWALCYRMTGSRADADDLAQEAIARAIERAAQLDRVETVDGWLFRIATTTCLDHFRRYTIERRANALADPLDDPELGPGGPEERAILRDDVRMAVMVALQRLPPKQRAVLVLRDVYGQSAEEVARAIDSNANAVKSLLSRARANLARARVREDVDVPVSAAVVERLAAAISAGSIDAIADLLAEDVWGIVDDGDGGKVRRPTLGRRAVARQWANAKRQLGDVMVLASLRALNGEPALVLSLGGMAFAVVHVETCRDRIVALRIDRDPARLRWLGVPLH